MVVSVHTWHCSTSACCVGIVELGLCDLEPISVGVGRLWACAYLIMHNHMYLLFRPTFVSCGLPVYLLAHSLSSAVSGGHGTVFCL